MIGEQIKATTESQSWIRRGVYGVAISNSGRVLVVRNGARFYLPGGGVEPGETDRQTLAREFDEEIARGVHILSVLVSHLQFVSGGLVLLATYALVRVGSKLHDKAELPMLWLGPRDAAERLHRPGDQIVLAELFGRGGITRPSPVSRGVLSTPASQ